MQRLLVLLYQHLLDGYMSNGGWSLRATAGLDKLPYTTEPGLSVRSQNCCFIFIRQQFFMAFKVTTFCLFHVKAIRLCLFCFCTDCIYVVCTKTNRDSKGSWLPLAGGIRGTVSPLNTIQKLHIDFFQKLLYNLLKRT